MRWSERNKAREQKNMHDRYAAKKADAVDVEPVDVDELYELIDARRALWTVFFRVKMGRVRQLNQPGERACRSRLM